MIKRILRKSMAIGMAMLLTISLFPQVSIVKAAGLTEDEDNGSVSLANNLPTNTNMIGALTNSSDKDYFQLTLTDPSVVSVSFDYADGVPDMRVTFLDSSNKEIFNTNYSSADQSLPGESNRYNLPSGNYYIRVSDYYGGNENTGDYTICVNASECEANREIEYNNSMNTATEAFLNEEMVGNLSNSKDKDFYKFTIPGNGSVSLEFDYRSGTPDMRLQLYQINKIDRNWNFSSSDQILPSHTNQYRLPAGTYYLSIEDYYGGSDNNQDYTIKVNYKDESKGSYEQEYNDSTSLATEIDNNTKMTGNLSASSDKDYYTFTINKTQNVTILYDYPSGVPDMRITVYNDDSKVVASNQFSSNDVSFPYKLKLNKIAAGSYYILIEDYYGGSENNNDYTLTVSTNGDSTSKLTKASIRSLNGIGYGKITISYNRITNASGYQITYSQNKNFAAASSMNSYGTKAIVSKLKKGRTYYFKVRAFQGIGTKKTYGSYSEIRSVKIR